MKRPTSPYTQSQPKPTELDWRGRLSFVRNLRGGGRNFWSVTRSGDYGSDCYIGFGLAREALHVMRIHKAPGLLNDVIADMVAGGKFDGVEVGFVSEISRAINGGRLFP